MFSRTVIAAFVVIALGVAALGEQSISEDIPEPASFRSFLIHDLTKYFAPQYGADITVDYQLLRDGPTITGISYPKYYLWLTVSQSGKTRVEGAARVAAIEKHFEVTNFVFRKIIKKRPDLLETTFPKAIVPAIRAKAASSL
jgi:hypothetical protein